MRKWLTLMDSINDVLWPWFKVSSLALKAVGGTARGEFLFIAYWYEYITFFRKHRTTLCGAKAAHTVRQVIGQQV